MEESKPKVGKPGILTREIIDEAFEKLYQNAAVYGQGELFLSKEQEKALKKLGRDLARLQKIKKTKLWKAINNED